MTFTSSMIDVDVEITNPFVGLRSFNEEESHLFFGREKQVDELLLRLRKHHFLAVIGTSGSGKSSLIRAGLIPALKSGFMTQNGSNWEIVVCRVGDDPILSLAKALNDKGVLQIAEPQIDENQNNILKMKLERAENGLANVVSNSKLSSTDNLLIVIDQFEEIFQHKAKGTKEATEAMAFIKLLLTAIAQNTASIYVVLTMRSDFIDDCAELPGLIEVINDSQYIIPRMSREQLRLAITGPIRVGGGELSSDLEKRLLNDIDDNPDHLPILQHAMLRMWDYWNNHQGQSSTIDVHHYEAIGTMERALSMHAEEAYHELETEREGIIAKVLFQAISEKRGKVGGVRRPTTAGNIARVARTNVKELAVVFERFSRQGRSFLVCYGKEGDGLDTETIIDVSHESILRLWDRLARWVDEEAESANAYLRLSHSAMLFDSGRSGLLKDPELSLALRWYDQQQPTAEWAERYDPTFMRAKVFLLKSKEEKENAIAQRELAQKRSLRKARLVAFIFGFLSIISIVFLIYAIVAQVKADQNLQDAKREQAKAETSRRAALKERERAMESEREAFEQKEKAIVNERLAREQEIKAIANAQLATRNERLAKDNERKAITNAKLAQEQSRIAEEQREEADEKRKEAEEQRQIANSQKNRADTLRIRALAKALAANSTRINEDELSELKGLLALQSHAFNLNYNGIENDPQIYEALFSANTKLNEKEQGVIEDHFAEVTSIDFSPDGKYFASGGLDGTIVVRSADGEVLGPPNKFKSCKTARCGVRDLSFNPSNSDQFVTAHQDNGVRVWSMDSKRHTNLAMHTAIVRKVAFSPDGNHLLSADVEGNIYIWNANNFTEIPKKLLVNGRISEILFLESGNDFYVATESGSVLAYDLNGTDKGSVVTGLGKVMSMSLIGEQNKLVVGNNEGKLFFIDLANKKTVDYLEHKSGITGLVVNKQGTFLATTSLDKNMKIFDLSDLNKTPITLKANGWIYDVSFTPDGNSVVFGSADNKIRKADTSTETLARKLCELLKGKKLTENQWERYVGDDIDRSTFCE
ncbi:MAG: hypothetical protein ACPGJS_03730 [Flammeovirgaceae bacterium]